MTESGAGGGGTNGGGRLDEIADELYGLRPDAFAAARDARVRQARADHQPALARELSKLRRPTQSAWLVNLLWRDQRAVMQHLLGLADELSRAQRAGSGPDVRRLTAERHELEATLLRRARSLAEQAQAPATAATEREVQETLAAALANPAVAQDIASGRLQKPATYAGFGTFPTVAAKPPSADPGEAQSPEAQPPEAQPPEAQPPSADPREAQSPEAQPPSADPREAQSPERPSRAPIQLRPTVGPPPPGGVAGRDEPERDQAPEPGDEHAARARRDVARREEEQARREEREEAERRVHAARAAADTAAGALTRQRGAALAAEQGLQRARAQVEQLRAQVEQLRAQIEQLRTQIEQLRDQLRLREETAAAAELVASAAAQARDRAQATQAAAIQALELAEQALTDLPAANP